MIQLNCGKSSQTDKQKVSPTKFTCGALSVFEKVDDIAKTAEKRSSVVV